MKSVNETLLSKAWKGEDPINQVKHHPSPLILPLNPSESARIPETLQITLTNNEFKTRGQRSALHIVKDRPGSNLTKCKTERKQKWRHASADAAAKKIITKAGELFFTDLVPKLKKTFANFGVQISFPNPLYEIFLKRISKLEDLNKNC
ncbi:hypothetical protein Glove_562g15 [Diversispora epigaea]|uniref:Uncharacterized protein n=1 Tax=Diversispora epigaea TaxID=1348612 RepID=A0A397GC43_9GLOM|nr:hypothetical protein Glove_562g15 [Diversispora epigaea]